MNYLEKNLAYIETHSPVLAQSIRTAAPEELGISCIPSRSGMPTLKVEKPSPKFLHSTYDPVKEAAGIVKKAVPADTDVVVIGGLGLGYLAESALEQSEHADVLVVEHSAAIVQAAFTHRDLSAILSGGRLDLIITDSMDDITAILDYKATRKITMLIHRPSADIYPDFYLNMKNVLHSFLNSKEVNIATLSRFERLWTRNLLRNIQVFTDHPGVRELSSAFAGVPAFIIGAGPSLAKNIRQLHRAAAKGIIIAVDTVYKVLLAHGIEPDFVVAVDPQHINMQYFRGITPGRTILVADSAISPALFSLFKGQVYISSAPFPFAAWFESFFGEKGSLMSGGSVSTAAFDLAEQMGCSPIILAGQDLAYSDERIHIQGTTGEEIWENNANRVKPVSRNMAGFLNRNKTAAITAYGGTGTVWSDRKFLTFLWWFERRIKNKAADQRIINATEGGARIKGAEELGMEELIESLPDCSRDTTKLQLQLHKPAPEHTRDTAFNQEIQQLQSYVLQVEKLAEEAGSIACAIPHKTGKEQDALLLELNRIDAAVQSKTVYAGLLSSILQKTIHTVREGFQLAETLPGESAGTPDTPEMDPAIRQTIELYHDIREAARLLHSYLCKYLSA